MYIDSDFSHNYHKPHYKVSINLMQNQNKILAGIFGKYYLVIAKNHCCITYNYLWLDHYKMHMVKCKLSRPKSFNRCIFHQGMNIFYLGFIYNLDDILYNYYRLVRHIYCSSDCIYRIFKWLY